MSLLDISLEKLKQKGAYNVWLTPKLDWTASDFYNFEDLNRVENNTEVIQDLIRNFGVYLELVIIHDRDMKRIEFADSLNRIEGNISELGQRYKPPGWLQNKLDWAANDRFNYQDATRLENNLYLLYRHYKENIDSVPYCGVYICGEEGI